MRNTISTFPDTRIKQYCAVLNCLEMRPGRLRVACGGLGYHFLFLIVSSRFELLVTIYCLVQAAEESEPEGTGTSLSSSPVPGIKRLTIPAHNLSLPQSSFEIHTPSLTGSSAYFSSLLEERKDTKS